jgi:hypothetical protein
VESQRTTTLREGPSTGYTQTVPARSARTAVGDEEAQDIETELARLIGPLARVLMRKARPLAASAQDLREALAASIQESRSREMFLAGESVRSQPPSSQSMPLPSHPLGAPVSRPRTQPTAPMRTQPLSQPVTTRPGTTARTLDIGPEELAGLELALSRAIGPMAKMLVRKETTRARSLKDFVHALCENIDNLEQRDLFMEAARRALQKRSF